MLSAHLLVYGQLERCGKRELSQGKNQVISHFSLKGILLIVAIHQGSSIFPVLPLKGQSNQNSFL